MHWQNYSFQFYSWISILSYFKMRNVIIWHWFIKNLVGTWRRNDVDAMSLRRIDVSTRSCACWEFGPPLPPLAPQYSKPWPPQYSKPSYAYEGIDWLLFLPSFSRKEQIDSLIGANAFLSAKPLLWLFASLDNFCDCLHLWTTFVTVCISGQLLWLLASLDNFCDCLHLWTTFVTVGISGQLLRLLASLDNKALRQSKRKKYEFAPNQLEWMESGQLAPIKTRPKTTRPLLNDKWPIL